VRVFETVLLALCLCILALRATYTEAPVAQMLTLPESLGDTIYSLTLSGLLIFALISWLAVRIYRGRLAYRITGIEFGLVVFGIAAVIAAVGASDKRSAITQTAVLIAPIFAALLLAQILNTDSRIRIVLTVVVGLGIVSTYQCAEQFLVSNRITIEQYEQNPKSLLDPLGIEPGTFQQFLFEHRLYSRGIRGFFTTSNSAASFAILASFAGIVLLVRQIADPKTRGGGFRRWLGPALAVFTIVAGLVLTQSKGGILAFLAGLALFAALLALRKQLGARRRLVMAVLVPLAALVIAGGAYGTISYGLRHGTLPGGNSMLVRWQYWLASARMYADHPFTGVGPGNFSHYYPHYKPAPALESVSDPHNFVLSLLAQYGPLGLLGFLGMVAAPLWRVAASRREGQIPEDTHSTSPMRKPALLMLSVICVCLLIFRWILIPTQPADSPDVLMYQVVALYITPLAAFLIGFLLAAAPLEETHPQPSRLDRTILSAALASAVLAVLLHNLIDFAIFEPGVWMTLWVVTACLVAAISPRQPDSANVRRNVPRTSHVPETGLMQATRSGGSVKAEGLGDGGWANHRQAALDAATRPIKDPRSWHFHNLPALRPAVVVISLALLGLYYLYVWRPVWNATGEMQQAQRAISAGQLDQAHEFLDAAFAADPLSAVPLNLNGRLYVQQYEQTGQKRPDLLEKAVRRFRRAIDTNPADYKSYERLAQAYGAMKQWQQACEWYGKAASLYPGCERLWFKLAQAAEQLSRTDAALAGYAKAVDIEESYQQQFRRMYPNREKVISRLGDEDLAIARKRMEELSNQTTGRDAVTKPSP